MVGSVSPVLLQLFQHDRDDPGALMGAASAHCACDPADVKVVEVVQKSISHSAGQLLP